MLKEIARYVVVAAAGLALWKMANIVQGTTEPWDGPLFLPIYGGALLLSGAFGYLFPDRAWRWGVILVFAMFVVMIVDAPRAFGPLVGVGLFILALLALLAAGFAAAGSLVRRPQDTV